jgi:predicted enzyme related to lactoylglutathione lyase
MSIDNALASVAVRNLKTAAAWYEKLFGRLADRRPMPEVLEWKFDRGGWLQIYQLPERAGAGSVTLVVTDLDAEIQKLDAMGVNTRQRSNGPRVRTVMVTDPDGNHIALAQALDPSIAL